MENKLEFIEKLGFRYAGKWELDKDEKIKANLIEGKRANKFIYAFVVDEAVKYVGITTSLAQRMSNYRNNLDENQYVNRRNNENITKILKDGKSVLIYALSENDVEKEAKEIKDLITYTAGLEDKLIEKMNLTESGWNKKGSKNENN